MYSRPNTDQVFKLIELIKFPYKEFHIKSKAISANYGASESDGGYAAVGFKAQEIKVLYPKAVFINDSGYLQINASALALHDEFIGQKFSGVASKCARILNTKYSLCF